MWKRKQQIVAPEEPAPTSLEFFSKLRWLDGRPLINTIEPYRRRLFKSALDTLDADGLPVCNFAVYKTEIRRKDGRGHDVVTWVTSHVNPKFAA